MQKRAFVIAVFVQTLAILAGCTALAAVIAMALRPLWEAAEPPQLQPIRGWQPYVLPQTKLWCWRPMGWQVREGKQGRGTQVIFQASPAAFVTIVAMRDSALQPVEWLQRIVSAQRRRFGFTATEVHMWPVGGRRIWQVSFSFWHLAGVRPIAWQVRVWAKRIGSWMAVVCASCDAEHFSALDATARQIVKTIKLLPSVRCVVGGAGGGKQVSTEQQRR